MVRTRLRRVRVLAAALVGISAVSLVAPAPTAEGHGRHWKPFVRRVEPWVPGSPPSTPPVVDLTAACVRHVGRGRLEAVFGYHNPGHLSVEVPLGPDSGVDAGSNAVVRTTWRFRRPHRNVVVENTGPQATQFLPGRHPHVFAVRFDRNERVAWQVRVPSSDDPNLDSGWKVTVHPRRLSRCGRRVPDHFAVVQSGSVFLSPTNLTRDSAGHITAYDVEEGTSGVRVVCSAGGKVVRHRQVLGWPTHPNIAPLPPDEIIDEVVVDNGAVFEMSRTRVRAVVDVFEPVRWFGPIADITGRCRFGREVARSDVYWAGLPQNGRIEPIIVGGSVVELVSHLDLPVGSRIR